MKIEEATLSAAIKLYAPPFRFDRNLVSVVDNDDNLVLDIRGWGRLTSSNEDNDLCAAVQDIIGREMADALTERWERRAAQLDEEKTSGPKQWRCSACHITGRELELWRSGPGFHYKKKDQTYRCIQCGGKGDALS